MPWSAVLRSVRCLRFTRRRSCISTWIACKRGCSETDAIAMTRLKTSKLSLLNDDRVASAYELAKEYIRQIPSSCRYPSAIHRDPCAIHHQRLQVKLRG